MKTSLLGSVLLLSFCSLGLSEMARGQVPYTEHTLKLERNGMPATARLEDVAWIAGHWTGQGLGGVAEEIWSEPRGGSMMGMFRLVRDNRTVFYELTALAEEGNAVQLMIKHFQPDLSGWGEKSDVRVFPLIRVSANEAFFEGITYHRTPDRSLEVFVALEDRKTGRISEERFLYAREAGRDDAVSVAPASQITHVNSGTPRQMQIQIAKLAAPKEVSDHADIYVLGEHGYELAEHGNNGFSCLIEREKPDTMEPECYDDEGTKTTLKVRIYSEQQRANRVAEQQIEESVRQGYKSGKFRPPSKPGIVYMLSDYNYVLNPETQKIIHFPGHLMFYSPYATEKTVGAGDGAPYIVHPGEPDALMIVVPAKSHSH